MIEALPEALRRSKASRAQRTVPSTLVFHTLSQASSSIWRKSLRSPTPALFTSTSSRPKVAASRCISAFTCSVAVTSTVSACAAPLLLTMVSAVSRAASPTRSATTTLAPSRAKVSAMARPMPAPAPVTSAILSSSRRIRPCHGGWRFPFVPERDELLGRAWMERHGHVELHLGRAHLERDRRHLHDLGGVRPEDVEAEHLVGRHVDHELHQHFLIAAGERVSERPEDDLVDVDHVTHLARRFLREADRADLRIGKDGGRYHHVIDGGRLIVEHRLGEGRRFMDGNRRQVHAIGHVANGIDIPDRGARELVDHDMAVPAEIDTGLVEPKPHGIGKPAGGGHDQAGMETVAAFEMDAVTSIYLFDAGGFRVDANVDA